MVFACGPARLRTVLFARAVRWCKSVYAAAGLRLGWEAVLVHLCHLDLSCHCNCGLDNCKPDDMTTDHWKLTCLY